MSIAKFRSPGPRCRHAITPEGAPLLPQDFTETGLAVHRPGTTPTRFQVLGERSSGTNFIKRLLGRNSALRPTEALGWKHGFVQANAVPADLAVICVLRAPAPWALSMHGKPWHCPPAMQALDFPAFIRAPWATIIDRPRYFGAGAGAALGTPLQQDRDPVTGRPCPNLFALRRAKLAALTSWLNRGVTCVLLRMEVAQSDPEATLDRLLSALGQPRRAAPFRPVMKRLGSRFRPAIATRPETPAEMSVADRAFMAENLDPAFEARLGYGW